MCTQVFRIFIAATLTTSLTACGTIGLPHSGEAPYVAPPPSASPSPSPPTDNQIPQSGSGEFLTAKGSQKVLGDGKTLITYRAEVESGIAWGDLNPVTPARFATEIEGILADERGWTTTANHPITDQYQGLTKASWRFQQVSGPDYQVRIRLATPESVDQLCAEAGLDTEGKYSCRFGTTIMVNLKRWLQGSPISESIDEYHAGVINHEIGHLLGFAHQDCPGSGQPAPVMMQQSVDLGGCTVNPWPFTGGGEFVTGPYRQS